VPFGNSFFSRHPAPSVSPLLDVAGPSADRTGLALVGHIPTRVDPPILALGAFTLDALRQPSHLPSETRLYLCENLSPVPITGCLRRLNSTETKKDYILKKYTKQQNFINTI